MMNEFFHYSIPLIICNILFFFLYLITDIVFVRKHIHLQYNDLLKELYRKTGHMGTCFILILGTFILPRNLCIFLSIEILFIVIAFRYLRLLHIAQVTRKTNAGIYGLFFAVSIALLIPDFSLPAIRIALLILSVSDTVASLIGKHFPFFPYILIEDKKTMAGSIGFFIATSIIMVVFASLLALSFWTILLIAYILTLTEALSYKGSDNFFLILLFIALLSLQFYQIIFISGIMTILGIYYAKRYYYNKRSGEDITKIF